MYRMSVAHYTDLYNVLLGNVRCRCEANAMSRYDVSQKRTVKYATQTCDTRVQRSSHMFVWFQALSVFFLAKCMNSTKRRKKYSNNNTKNNKMINQFYSIDRF